MRIEVQTILELSIEQMCSGLIWPHPWDHYPFLVEGARVWKRYEDLTPEQKRQVTHALDELRLLPETEEDRVYQQFGAR